MYCVKCGTQLEDGAKFCSMCGTRTANTAPAVSPTHPPSQPIVIQAQPQVSNSRPCPRCKGMNVQFQTVAEAKKTGCMKVFLYIFLAITILGWLILIPLLLRKKTRTVTYGICQSCGHRWEV